MKLHIRLSLAHFPAWAIKQFDINWKPMKHSAQLSELNWPLSPYRNNLDITQLIDFQNNANFHAWRQSINWPFHLCLSGAFGSCTKRRQLMKSSFIEFSRLVQSVNLCLSRSNFLECIRMQINHSRCNFSVKSEWRKTLISFFLNKQKLPLSAFHALFHWEW